MSTTHIKRHGRAVWKASNMIRPYVAQCKRCKYSETDPDSYGKWYVCEMYNDLPFWTMPVINTFAMEIGEDVKIVRCTVGEEDDIPA